MIKMKYNYNEKGGLESTEVTEEEYNAYEKVRMSCQINMCDLQEVMALTSLDVLTVMTIMKDYGEIRNKFER